MKRFFLSIFFIHCSFDSVLVFVVCKKKINLIYNLNRIQEFVASSINLRNEFVFLMMKKNYMTAVMTDLS